jgi:hypothetical protein
VAKVQKVGFLCLWALGVALLGLAGSGCNIEQLEKVDRIVADANTIGGGIAAIPDGPAGALIPREVVIIMELLGIGAAAAYGIWQRIRASGILERNADLSVTLKAVVDAIDKTGGQEAENVKANVLALATRRRVYDVADAIIDEHRAAKQAAA